MGVTSGPPGGGLQGPGVLGAPGSPGTATGEPASAAVPAAGTVSEAPSRGEGSPLRWGLGLIAALAVLMGILIRNSFFFADDFLTFGYAHREGFSPKFVFVNLFGHIAPVERITHLIPLNYSAGEAVILAFYVLLLLTLLWVLRELRVGLPVTLTVLFVVGTSTILLNETLYYDQTVFLFPASTFILGITALFVRWVRTGRARYLYLSWLAFALSFVTQERPLVVLAYLVVLRYLVLPRRLAPGGRRKFLSDWRVWLPFALIGGAYAGYYVTLAPHSNTTIRTMLDFLRIAPQNFFRGVIGAPFQPPAGWVTITELVFLLVITVAVIAVATKRMLIAKAALFFVVCLVVNLLPVVHGIGGVIGAAAVAGEMQYYVDPLLALGVAAGIAASEWLAQPTPLPERAGEIADQTAEQAIVSRRSRITARRTRRYTVYGCLAVVVVHLALLPLGFRQVFHQNGSQPAFRSWVANLNRSLMEAARKAPRPDVVGLTIPQSFVPAFEAPYNLEQPLFGLLPAHVTSGGGPVEVVGPTGDLIKVSAGDSVTVSGGPELAGALNADRLRSTPSPPGFTCMKATGAAGAFTVVLPRAVGGRALVGHAAHL